MIRTVVFCLVFLFVFAGCSDRPKDIIPEDKLVQIMTDLQIAEAYDRNGDSDPAVRGANRELLGRGILMNYGVSVQEMDSTLAWYGRNMDEYAKLYKKVDARLAKLQQNYASAAGASDSEGTSTDLWPYARHFVVDANQLTDGLVVNIPLPDIAAGDKLTWKLRTFGSSSRRISLGVDYDDGRSAVIDNSGNGFDPWIEASLQTDTLGKVTRIFAILDISRSSSRAFVDSVMLLHYPLNREEYHKIGYQRKIGAPQRVRRNLPADSVEQESKDTLFMKAPGNHDARRLKPVKAMDF